MDDEILPEAAFRVGPPVYSGSKGYPDLIVAAQIRTNVQRETCLGLPVLQLSSRRLNANERAHASTSFACIIVAEGSGASGDAAEERQQVPSASAARQNPANTKAAQKGQEGDRRDFRVSAGAGAPDSQNSLRPKEMFWWARRGSKPIFRKVRRCQISDRA